MAEILDATAADITAARDRLIVALDVPTVSEAEALIAQLGDTVTFFKVGLELVMNGGMKLVTALKDQGRQVFLDVKFLDIDTTVEKATANAARSGADFLTVHATDSKTLKAAARGAAGSQLRVLGVTVLTSLDGADLAEQGISSAPADLVVHRAKLAYAAGCHGVIASGQEAASVRQAIPDRSFAIVTPGIRLPSDDVGDQARVTTPDTAIGAGATHIVVGRPITQAPDPKAAAELFVERIAAAT
ncbi:MAG: orotidine-5'-phosphate decarboxylase [Hyphomicrobiaceae bacterium]